MTTLLSPRISTSNRGTGTLVAGTVTIPNTGVQATSIISLTGGALNASTAIGNLIVSAIVPGVSFTVTSIIDATVATQTGDLRTINYSF
jgi:hypothetical protein